MSVTDNSQEELFTANNELQDFLPENDPMVIFSKEIYPYFKDEDFLDCYSVKGRPAISPAFLACVTVLQFKESMSDPEAAESCIRRMDWKYALHIPLMQKSSFDPSTLVYFRRRLKENNKMALIFDKILKLVQEKGLIKKRSKQRVDATHIIAHVNRISTTDLLFRAVKCVTEEIEKKDSSYYEKEVPEHIKERYSQGFSSFGMSKAKRADKQAEIVEDGLYLKKLLEEFPGDELGEIKQLDIMKTIFNENVIISKKEINDKIFIEVEEIQIPKQTIFDPRDTSIQLGKKGRKSWVGSKCHIVETAEKGEINYLTDMVYQRANENDNKIHDKIKDGNKRNSLEQEKLYADSNYISSTAIKEYREDNSELMGYVQKDTSKRSEDFKLEKFDINMNTMKATCPYGKKSQKSQIAKDGRINIYFNKEDCINCPFFKDCVGEKAKDKRRRLHVQPDYAITRERRNEQKKKAFRKEMSVRAQVEGTISEGTRFHGLRHAKYRGEAGHQLQFYLIGAAINVKRLIKTIMKGKNKLILAK